jgi:hypothetical protein
MSTYEQRLEKKRANRKARRLGRAQTIVDHAYRRAAKLYAREGLELGVWGPKERENAWKPQPRMRFDPNGNLGPFQYASDPSELASMERVREARKVRKAYRIVRRSERKQTKLSATNQAKLAEAQQLVDRWERANR